MAVIGTIRNRFGTVLIVIVGVALAAFVLGDLFKARPQRHQVYLGEFGDEKITYADFDEELTRNVENTKRNQNKSALTPDELFNVKEQTWKELSDKILLSNEFDQIGMGVSSDELFDQIQGDDPHPWILQFFTDPETKQYDPEIVRNYLKGLSEMPQEQRVQWYGFEQSLKADHVKTKYKTLLTASFNIPDTFMTSKFIEQRTSANIRVIGISNSTIPDSLVSVSEEEMKAFYEENNSKYLRNEPTRDIDYVIFDVKPSADDRMKIREQVFNVFNDFKTAVNIASFVSTESDTPYDSTYKDPSKFPVSIASKLETIEVGDFIDPFVENETWYMAKLVDVQMRPDSMKASHILISYAGSRSSSPDVSRVKPVAESLADSLFSIVKNNPSKFDALVKEYSDDPSAATNNGDLGWFADGAMVPEFNEAVFKGDVGKFTMVESVFGYHIIRIDGKTDFNKKYRLAIVDRVIEPSQQTFQQVYAQASEFKVNATSQEVFDTLVDHYNLSKRNAPYLTPMRSRISGLAYPRAIVQWSFRDGVEVGSVSDIFTMEDQYIVAIVTKASEKGYVPFEDVRESVEPLLIKEKKIKMLADQLAETIKKAGSFEEIASMENLVIDTIPAVTFSMRSIGRFGQEDKLISKVFELEPGVVSSPIEGGNYAFVVVVDEKVDAPTNADVSFMERQLKSGFESAVRNDGYIQTLKDKTDFVDNRHMFY